ncbi:MAG: polysaccharide deacetylase family protein [Chloroflexota bacterium]
MSGRVAFTIDLEQDAPPFLDTYRGAEEGMPRLLALLREAGVPATVFSTGDVARRYPDLVREIVSSGHELACHGDTHKAFDRMSDAEAADEIARSTATLRAFAPVRAFRAPYLRLPGRHLALLRESGDRIDS